MQQQTFDKYVPSDILTISVPSPNEEGYLKSIKRPVTADLSRVGFSFDTCVRLENAHGGPFPRTQL